MVATLVPLLMLAFSIYRVTPGEMRTINGPAQKFWDVTRAKTAPVPHMVIGLSQSLLLGELRGPIAPVCGPFFFMDFPRFLCLELRPVPTRDLHRVVLGQFVFVVGPLEETTLEDDRGEIYQFFIVIHTL